MESVFVITMSRNSFVFELLPRISIMVLDYNQMVKLNLLNPGKVNIVFHWLVFNITFLFGIKDV